MSTASWHTPAVARPVPFRMRADLRVELLRFQNGRYWSIKDPVSLRYHQLPDEEYTILQMLDGRTSLGQVRDRFERLFAPTRLTLLQLQSYLAGLHEQGLIVADTAGQGGELLERQKRSRWQSLRNRFSNPLAIYFRGFDPEPVLRWLYPKCRWMFSSFGISAAILLVIAAIMQVAIGFDVLVARLPAFEEMFNLQGALSFLVAIAIVKILHEFGHALACRHFGGECHEMGVLFLVFAPCLYCNVSDAWMLPNKWHRIAISAAGMCVEAVLAAICVFVWWYTEPGFLHALSLKLIIVCSISSFLFNANPLLRYDGYYILADLVEVPNLRQRATGVVKSLMAQWFLEVDDTNIRQLPPRGRWWLAAYAVASTVYRWFLVIVILWFCHRVLEPYGLEVLALGLGVLVAVGMIAVPASQATRFVRNSARMERVNWLRLTVRGGLVAVLLLALLLVPWRYPLAVPVVVEPQGAQRVYVSVGGELTSAIAEGATVTRGQTLATLENLELLRDVKKLEGQRDRQQSTLANLLRRRVGNADVAAQIPAAQEALADLEERLRQRRRDLERLTLTAPRAGTVLPPPAQPHDTLPGQLPRWSGNPLDERNHGAYLETGTILCRVGDADRMQAVLFIDQSEIESVRTGQRVRIRLEELPWEVMHGRIDEIAAIDLDVAPRELVAHADFAVQPQRTGQAAPLRTSYQARVTLDPGRETPLIGASGRARIEVDAEPLYKRLHRYLNRTFRFDL